MTETADSLPLETDGTPESKKENYWYNGRIVDVRVRRWDEIQRAGIAEVLPEADAPSPPPDIFLVDNLFADPTLHIEAGSLLRGRLHSHTFGGHWLLEQADYPDHSPLDVQDNNSETKKLLKAERQKHRESRLVSGQTYIGKITAWDEAAQAGQIKVKSIKAKIGFTRRNLRMPNRLPEIRQAVSFVAKERDGRWEAAGIVPQGYVLGFAEQASSRPSPLFLDRSFSAVLLACAFVILHLSAVSFISLPVVLTYLCLSGLLLSFYRFDKRTAQNNGQRGVPDMLLHLLALLGGWPGGLLAQLHYRHQVSNIRFIRTFWFLAALNVVWTYLFLVHWIHHPALAFLKN